MGTFHILENVRKDMKEICVSLEVKVFQGSVKTSDTNVLAKIRIFLF